MSENTKFKGWQVLGGGFVNAMLIAGASIYAYGSFVRPIEAEFGLTREQANYGILGLYISMMFWAVFVGRWLDKYSAKTFSILGALAFGVGYALISTAQSPLIILIAIMGLVAFGFTAAGPFLENALAARWFTKKRGRALGIAAVATSAGGAVVVPIVGELITQFEWRKTMLILAVAVPVIIILISLKFIVSRPEDIGQHPDGAANETEQTTETEDDIAAKPFFKRAEFWLIALGTGLLLGSDQALLVSLVPYGEERGFTIVEASWLFSVMTTSAIAGKLVVGWLAERWDKRLLFALVCLSNIAFLVAVLMAPSYQQLVVVVAFVGLAIGGVYPVWTTLVAQYFGRKDFAKVIGAMNLVTVPLMLISITIAGRTHDMTGDYNLAFKIFIPQVILAAIVVLLIRKKKELDV